MSRLLRVALSCYLQLPLSYFPTSMDGGCGLPREEVTGSRSLSSRAISKRSRMWGGDEGIQHLVQEGALSGTSGVRTVSELATHSFFSSVKS